MTQTTTFYENLTAVGSSNIASGLSAPLATPVITSITTATTGGSLPVYTTYFYKVVAVDALGGLSLPSNEVSITTGATATNTVTINWNTVPGAATLRVYRGTTSNGQSVWFSSGFLFSYTDSSTTGGTNGTPPITITGYSLLANNTSFISPVLDIYNGAIYLKGSAVNSSGGIAPTRGANSVDFQSAKNGLNSTYAQAPNSGLFAGSGNAVIATATAAGVFCGASNTVRNPYSKAFGYFALANLYGQTAFASGNNGTQGDAQDSLLTARNITTNTAAPTELLLDGNGGTNYFTIATNSTQPFIILASARGTAGTNAAKSAAWKIEGVVVNNGGTITILSHSITTLAKEVAAWDISISVVSTRLAITATGDATSTIKWFASIWHTMNLS